MSMHQVEYEYKILEGAAMTLDLDTSLDPDEKEQIILAEIKECLGAEEYCDVEITNIKELN